MDAQGMIPPTARSARARPSGRPRLVAVPRAVPAPPKLALPPIPPPDPSFIRDSYASTALAEIIDRSVHAATARFTVGLSPMALMGSYLDWAAHLAFAPGKQAQLAEKAFKKWLRLGNYASRCAIGGDGDEPCIQPLPQDHRFAGDAWQSPPFNLMYQAFLLGQQWWHNAMTGVRGVNRRNENMVAFATRQFLDVWSPSNAVFTNPEVLARTQQEGAMNLVRGWQNLVEDWERAAGGRKPVGAEAFEVGRNVAVTPGTRRRPRT
jgi:polyhydroxyalkanoate synthase